MSKKIVAIGGGENGRLRSDGTRYPYELANQDKEIIRLTGKQHPNFLFIAHAQPLDGQEGYFQVMVDIYGKMYGCPCKHLKSNNLTDAKYVKQLVDWADIIFEGGGNTLDMIKLWQATGFDQVLKQAWENGKVMCGVSAGANCWFKQCLTDSLQIKQGADQPLVSMQCLGFVDGFFVPHCNNTERLESAKHLLKTSQQIGLGVANCTALEIVDNHYRLITSDASQHNTHPFGLKMYWENGEFFQEEMDASPEFKPLEQLLSRNIKRGAN